ncbi:hypothetical protein M011DRAFT_523466 [Sporormia fimetaria CBS 119925]|uniref:Uncharacterized protein n=1 Tax=Sporormia fimetaria CBS 119925 TaxID=1340428 RepID=A0A6A6VLL3_9PLEO|nr:hypothetical protein M011DRAFT_523466 [Sporormia fimetaria CBS 119925]
MGNCGSSIDCSQCYGEPDWCLKELDIDPDVAGMGVLSAFLAAAFLTCAAILLGYTTDSFPESVTTPVDAAVVRRWQRTWFVSRFLPWLDRRWFGCKTLAYRCFRRAPPTPRPHIPRDQRMAAITRLVLGFSDTQLVTGLAIVTAVLVNHCRLKYHEVAIADALIWFTASCHVATLQLLREYFYDNPVVRNWRMIGIVVLPVLLGYLEVVLILADGNAARPIQCAMDGTTIWSELEFFTFVKDFGPFLILLSTYLYNTAALFFDPRSMPRGYAFFPPPAGLLGSGLSNLSKAEQHQLYTQSCIQVTVLDAQSALSGWTFRLRTVRSFRRSLLSIFADVSYLLSYAVGSIVDLVWSEPLETTGSTRRMGFGQVVPLILLAIPALLAAETYNGEINCPSCIKHCLSSVETYKPRTNSASGTTSANMTTHSSQGTDSQDPFDLVPVIRNSTPQEWGIKAQFPPKEIYTAMRQTYSGIGSDEQSAAYASISLARFLSQSPHATLSKWTPPTRLSKRSFYFKLAALFIPVWILHIFCGAIFANSFFVILGWMGFLTLDRGWELLLQRELIRCQLEFRADLAAYGKGTRELGSGTLASSAASSVGGTEDIEPLKKQDTEADIGLVHSSRPDS